MQISRKLAKSKRGSLHFRKRLTAIFVVALLMVVVVLVICNDFPRLSVAGDESGSSGKNGGSGDYTYFETQESTPTPTSTPTTTSTPPSTPTNTPPVPSFTPSVTPEFGFAGGIVAIAMCFIAFGVFARAGKLFNKPSGSLK
jgi:hypothetical protein